MAAKENINTFMLTAGIKTNMRQVKSVNQSDLVHGLKIYKHTLPLRGAIIRC